MSIASARIDWVDYAKGWCIVLVVMMHSTLGVGSALDGEGVLHEVVAFARPFRMPDFFLISGLFLSRVIDLDWRSYLDRKVLHFLYFFVIWTTIQIVVKKGWLLITAPGMFMSEFAFAFVEPYGTLWFIYLLPVFFLTVKMLRPLPKPALLAFAVSLELGIHVTGWSSGFIMIDEFMARFVYFCVGAIFAARIFAFARWVVVDTGRAVLALVVWAIGEALIAFLPATLLPLSMVPDHLIGTPMDRIAMLPGISLAAGVMGACAVIALSSLLAARGKLPFLGLLGEHSIIIYLAFFLPMAVARTVFIALGMTSVAWVSLMVTVVSIGVPLLLYRLVRNTPAGLIFWRPGWARLAPSRKPPPSTEMAPIRI